MHWVSICNLLYQATDISGKFETVLKENYALIVFSSRFKMKFKYPFVVRGFYVFRVYWDSITGETLDTEPEIDGEKFGDQHSVAVKKGVITVGHIPKDILFLPNTSLYMAEQ